MGTYAEDITYDYYYLQWLEEIGSKYTVIFSQSILMTLKLCAIESWASYYLLPVSSLPHVLNSKRLSCHVIEYFRDQLRMGVGGKAGKSRVSK